MIENYDLFPKDKWITCSEEDHRDTTDLLKAAVMSAKSGSDKAIKHVFCYLKFFIKQCLMEGGIFSLF